jgi:hypothetical protein
VEREVCYSSTTLRGGYHCLFLPGVHSARVKEKSEDKLWWIPSKRRLFKVKSFYSSLTCTEGSHFPSKSVWRTRVPLRAAFFPVVGSSR